MTQSIEAPPISNGNVIVRRQTVMGSLAERYEMDPVRLLDTLKATCIKGNATNEQVQAFCIVANRYSLDPFLKEIHAFAAQGGGIVPIVGIDGWSKIANATDRMNGCEFSFEGAGDDLACTCTIYIKGRDHPVRVTEYIAECKRNTPPWNQYKRRMLRHRAFIQCARLAFGFGGIYDEDEARDILKNDTPQVPQLTNAAERLNAALDDAPRKPVQSRPATPAPVADDRAEQLAIHDLDMTTAQETAPDELPADVEVDETVEAPDELPEPKGHTFPKPEYWIIDYAAVKTGMKVLDVKKAFKLKLAKTWEKHSADEQLAIYDRINAGNFIETPKG